MAWAASILASGGWSALDVVLLTCFAVAMPWTVLGFWNAVIGLWLLKIKNDGLHHAAPFLASDAVDAPHMPLSLKSAIVMTLRNEEPHRAIQRLKIVKDSLDATGNGAQFSYFILSDSDDTVIASEEERLVASWASRQTDPARIIYRRRDDNTGFKAGNLRDFCERWGDAYDAMLPLDADSLMTGNDIVELSRIMERHPQFGILQSLVVGTPAASAFARIFQFGMRLGMRTYTMGQAWWTGDCGPYWGHNALVRIKPFKEHCTLPVLPGDPPFGGPILSHDQVEAVLMRRSGFEVRVMPIEGGSFEDNPPDALSYMTRDIRWCQGNMQYVKLLTLPGLLPVSRFQLVWAILMFIGVPAWTLMIALSPLAAQAALADPLFPVDSLKYLYLTVLMMFLSPKLAGFIDVLGEPREVRRFGGRARFISGAAIELAFTFLLGALTALRTSIFMIALLFGTTATWSSPRRDGVGVSWNMALAKLWPHMLFGCGVLLALYAISFELLIWSLPLTAGFVVAVPFAVLTADPSFGVWMRQAGLAAIPEDIAPPPEIVALKAARGGKHDL